jgi:hypothetical protein
MLVALLLGTGPFGQSAAAASASDAPDDQFILEVLPKKTRAYVHEAVPLTVTLLAGPVSIRNVQYPRLVGEAFRTADYAPPRQASTTRNDREYAAYEFSTTLVASRSGDIELGPAELQFDLLAPGSGAAAFFGDSEPRPVTVRSQPVRFTVLPLPAKGKPAGFSGAVGRFTLAREVSPKAIQSGDPVTLTTRIEGAGNIDSFSCPALSLPGVRAYPPVASLTESSLVCEQVLIPETATAVEIPVLSVSYFDPRRERYQTLTSQAIEIPISPATSPASAAPTTAVTAAAAVAAVAPETSDPPPVSATPLGTPGRRCGSHRRRCAPADRRHSAGEASIRALPPATAGRLGSSRTVRRRLACRGRTRARGERPGRLSYRGVPCAPGASGCPPWRPPSGHHRRDRGPRPAPGRGR